MSSRPLAVTAVALVALALAAGASGKGTPSSVTVTCGAGVQRATVTVQLVSGLTNPSPASNQLALTCSSTAPIATTKIAPLSQPAAAYAWSAFVTATTATFGCGGTTARGSTVTCVNAAGGTAQVTVLAA